MDLVACFAPETGRRRGGEDISTVDYEVKGC